MRADLERVWRTLAPETLAGDLERFPAELADPFTWMRVLLDTSVLIGAESPGDFEGAISAASLAELHFGVLVARDFDAQGRRAQRLGVVEATFDPLPIDARVGREWAASPPRSCSAAASPAGAR